ncbi:MAG: Fur family transcriptional regulator [Lachnospiraceae bacterium]|nr:transcriptional repressor [Lachnospiraceae bacterium]MDD7050059.1 Fur family transcriptional regulator [Lachnospiraceae bacterium]MDY4097449.1 Fur family transcriptional regulator [Lachnospiraceae bacterium]MDY5955638.1 Fur family transcriptional regulator [Frisingicoccus sp.]
MEVSYEELKRKLIEKNINPSLQRLKVLKYLIEHNSHPTVDEIYTNLFHEIPTLSKTTVYNTLKVLAEAGLVKVLTIENNETRYDSITENHGHFKCDSCGKIYNFSINVNLLEAVNFEDLTHYRISERNVYFKGICPNCLKNINMTKED